MVSPALSFVSDITGLFPACSGFPSPAALMTASIGRSSACIIFDERISMINIRANW